MKAVTTGILAYDFYYRNNSFKTGRHIFFCIQLQVQVRTVCDFFNHMPIHFDIRIGHWKMLKAAFSSHPLLWIYELYQPGCCLNICEGGITAFCIISLWPKCNWEYLKLESKLLDTEKVGRSLCVDLKYEVWSGFQMAFWKCFEYCWCDASGKTPEKNICDSHFSVPVKFLIQLYSTVVKQFCVKAAFLPVHRENLQDKFYSSLNAAAVQMFFLRQMLICPTPVIITPELLFYVYTVSVPGAARAASQWFFSLFFFLSFIPPALFK